LESFYVALCRALGRAGIRVRREVGIPAMYKGKPLALGFRADILVDETVILEIKAVPALLPVHKMQLQNYLRMSGPPVGLLFNVHALRLKDGLLRFVG
jgi:GxxExxY protein